MMLKNKLNSWMDNTQHHDRYADRDVRFLWVGKTYQTGIGIIILMHNKNEILDFELYPLNDVPIFKRSYARSKLFATGTAKENALKSILERVENTTDTRVMSDELMKKCGVLVDYILY